MTSLSSTRTRSCRRELVPCLRALVPCLRSHAPYLRSHAPYLRSHAPYLRSHAPYLRSHAPFAKSHLRCFPLQAATFAHDRALSPSCMPGKISCKHVFSRVCMVGELYNFHFITIIKSYVFDYIVTLFYNKDNSYSNKLHSKKHIVF